MANEPHRERLGEPDPPVETDDSSHLLDEVSSRPTIADVARLCGVTPGTVSRVLNNKQKFSASDAVRQKIFDTARKLGYVPDLAARNLGSRNTRIVGLFASPQTHLGD